MSDEDIFEELANTDRRLWEAGGGTMAGYAALCEKIALQARAEYAKYGDAWRGVGREPDWRKVRTGTDRPNSDGEEPVWEHAEVVGESLCVREEDAPKYGETSDWAQKGGKGE